MTNSGLTVLSPPDFVLTIARNGVPKFDGTCTGERGRSHGWRDKARAGQGHLLLASGCANTEGAQGRLNGTVECLNLFVEKVNVGELHRQQLTVMILDDAGEGLLDQGKLRAHAAFRQFRHRSWVGSPSDERFQHRS